MTEFGIVTQVAENHVLWVSHVPTQRVRGPGVPKFLGPLPTPKPFDLQWRNLVWQHMWGSSVFLGVSHALIPKSGPQRPQIFRASIMRPHSMRNSKTKFWMIKLDMRQSLTRSTTNADARSVCGS